MRLWRLYSRDIHGRMSDSNKATERTLSLWSCAWTDSNTQDDIIEIQEKYDCGIDGRGYWNGVGDMGAGNDGGWGYSNAHLDDVEICVNVGMAILPERGAFGAGSERLLLDLRSMFNGWMNAWLNDYVLNKMLSISTIVWWQMHTIGGRNSSCSNHTNRRGNADIRKKRWYACASVLRLVS